MSILGILFFTASIITAASAFLILNKNSKSDTNAYFALLCLAATLWLFGFGNMFISQNEHGALMWSKIGFAGLAFIPVFFLRFVYAFTKKIINVKTFIIFYVLSAAAVILNCTTPLFYSDITLRFFGYYPKAGFLYILLPVQLVFFMRLASKNLKSYLRRPDLTAYRHKQAKSISSSVFILYVLFIDHLLTFIALPIYPFGEICMAVFISVVVISLKRYEASDIKIILSRAFIMAVLAAVILSFSYFVWKYSGSWIISSALTFVLSFIGTYLYRAAIDKAEDLFLAEQKKYSNTLIQAASSMAREHNLKRLLKLMAIIVMHELKVKNFAVFLENKDKKTLECHYIRPSVPSEIISSYSYMHPFIMFIRNKKRPFTAADLPLYIINSAELPFRPAFVIPFFFDNGTNGFITLSSKKDDMPFTWEDIRTFEALSRQASLAIESCLFFDEFKNTQERIFAAEKLASVGGLAEGVAHQINNRLNQFSMISGELKYEIADFIKANEKLVNDNKILKKTMIYITELSDSLTENIKRTDAVIKGILNYSRAEKQGTLFSHFSLKEAFGLSLELLNLKHKLHKDFKIDFNLQNDDDKIYGIRSQITEAVYNIIDNAYEATKEKYDDLSEERKTYYKPLIKVTLKHTDLKHIISIEDNGCGIKDENISKIFAPFFTTKSSYKSGTGIGMYIVRRMIEENHKGKVSFESKCGSGTKITFELPVKADNA
ncbi:MAG: ATP-binding protein [Endomicrobia bacterium]|nr:ATP-binding protein [Endomicrobiia bacterium]